MLVLYIIYLKPKFGTWAALKAMKIAAESLSLHAAVDDKQSLGLDFIESMRQRLLATAGYLKLLQVHPFTKFTG